MEGHALRQIPSLERLLSDERFKTAAREYPHEVLVGLAREYVASIRSAASAGLPIPTFDEIVDSLVARLPSLLQPSLRPVINATGVIIHTNLGRAPLSCEAIEAMEAVSRGYSNLEFDIESGERGSRYSHLESVLVRLTGAEAAIAVNNNAAALLLTLSAVARNREVIISRGQLVEIGGGFRIPDVMAQSGARLVEVGTTNRTYIRDFDTAITDETVALLRVHSSNFRIIGFTESVPLTEMVKLGHGRNLLVIDDIGSGCLLDVTKYGLAPEPTVQASLAAGADLVLFSGDKLLGGPQAGIIVGRAELIGALRRHPLARAVRLDKATISGLAATLLHYLKGEAEERVPVWRMIAAPVQELERRAVRWSAQVRHGSRVTEGRSMIGGGSLPEESLPTALMAVPRAGPLSARDIARRLRSGNPPVIARVERDEVLLDPRTVDPADDDAVVQAVLAAIAAPTFAAT